MHRPTLLVSILLTAALPAAAQHSDVSDLSDTHGSVAVGANRSISGLHGIAIRSWVSDRVGLQGTVGFDYSSATSNDDASEDTLSSLDLGLGIAGLYKVVSFDRGSLAALAAADVELASSTLDSDGTSNSSSEVRLALGAGLQGEWFLARQLSVFAQTGLRFRLLTDRDAAGLEDVSGVAFEPAADLMGTVGFSIWFR